jgi:hypothetical protein
MRIWKLIDVDLSMGQTDPVSDCLGDWLREALKAVPAGPVEIETNLGGLDEAGSPSPDFEWIELITGEFPQLRPRVIYRLPRARQEAIAPHEVLVRWSGSVRRAWIEIRGHGRWAVLEE